MKKFLPLLLFLALVSCGNNKEETPLSENDLDAARNFIRAALDGKFDDARRYMIRDEENMSLMDAVERSFRNLDQPTRDGYRTSTIRILQKKPINDSTVMVIYANSFKNDPDTLKVLRMGQEWLVDFKYLYRLGSDTSGVAPARDTIP